MKMELYVGSGSQPNAEDTREWGVTLSDKYIIECNSRLHFVVIHV